jgi:hypothetical protein
VDASHDDAIALLRRRSDEVTLVVATRIKNRSRPPHRGGSDDSAASGGGVVPGAGPNASDEGEQDLEGESVPLNAPGAPGIKSTVGEVLELAVKKGSTGLGVSLAGGEGTDLSGELATHNAHTHSFTHSHACSVRSHLHCMVFVPHHRPQYSSLALALSQRVANRSPLSRTVS